MTQPDRDLDEYLKGDSALSRRYREASRETAPPELDAAILAQARVPLRRARPRPWFSGLALAASLVLGVNLAWNVYRVEPVPLERQAPSGDASTSMAAVPPEAPRAAAPAPVAPDEQRAGEQKAPARADVQRRAELAQRKQADSQAQLQESAKRKVAEEDLALAKAEARESEADAAQLQRSADFSAPAAVGAAGMAAPAPSMRDAAPPPALGEAEKIDRLIAYVASLDGAVFIRNGKEYGPVDAAAHMRLKREKAGKRVQTADDFIRLCASHSYLSGEAYLIRFKDGRTRTAEDVLREQLASMR